MLVLNLSCANQHHFEGWFGSAADFQSQLDQAMLNCPICADQHIKRLPTAPHLNVSHLRAGPADPAAKDAKPTAAPLLAERAAETRLKKLQAAVAQVLANTDDVGDRFAEEARRIHYGETKPHGIRGQASAAEVADLTEEGIAVLPLAMPAVLKGSLQ
ncbi:DUF1178 family protein [Roseateles sp.]|uniref:DUF1178 family protein n=1 Tax=Roseateles sp. TaxID=1971397 RepID=UPI00286CCF1A|nr:DUF1178 family protein [Roseateles sp.]